MNRTALVAARALVVLVATGCSAAPAPGSVQPTSGGSVTASPSTATSASSASPTASAGSPTASQPVAASELRRLAVPALGFDQPVSPLSSVAMGNAIDPPRYAPGRPSAPVRVSDKGVRPASDADDTVYVGCHTSAIHGPDQYPCDVLIRAVSPGTSIVATTDAGVLTYTVTKTRTIPYGDFAGDDETWRIEPKRLVFVVCDVLDGLPTHANYVIYATLH